MVVLIVDDDAVSLLLAGHIVRGGGHDVISADSAEAAMEILAEDLGSIDMIVCDYYMPGASGLDLLEHLHEQVSVESSPPFILLTGISEAEELNDPRAALVSGYLTKPVRSSELQEMLISLAAQPTVRQG